MQMPSHPRNTQAKRLLFCAVGKVFFRLASAGRVCCLDEEQAQGYLPRRASGLFGPALPWSRSNRSRNRVHRCPMHDNGTRVREAWPESGINNLGDPWQIAK
jgi:hypothetical protein